MHRAKIAGSALRGFASHSANQAPLIILICPGGGLADHTRAPGRSTAVIHPTHPHFPPSVGLLFVSSPQLVVRVVSPLLAKPRDKAHYLSIMPIAIPPVLRHRIDAIPNATGADGLPGRSASQNCRDAGRWPWACSSSRPCPRRSPAPTTCGHPCPRRSPAPRTCGHPCPRRYPAPGSSELESGEGTGARGSSELESGEGTGGRGLSELESGEGADRPGV